MLERPLFYVHGNHDESCSREPQGCICLDDKLVKFNGVRLLGLGGSYPTEKANICIPNSR